MGHIQYNTKWKTIDQNEVLRLHSKHYTINDICLELRTTEYVIDKILKLHGLKGGTKLDRLKDKYQDIIKFYSNLSTIVTCTCFIFSNKLRNKIFFTKDLIT